MWSVHLHKIDRRTSEIRVFASGKSFGDPWEWGCNLRRRGFTAHLSLAKDGPPMLARRLIIAELRRLNFKVVEWERSVGGKMRTVSFLL